MSSSKQGKLSRSSRMCLHQLTRSEPLSYRAQKQKLSNRFLGGSLSNNSSEEPQGVWGRFEKLGLESVNVHRQDPRQVPSDQPSPSGAQDLGAPARVAKAPARPPVAVSICALPSPGNKWWIRPPRLSVSPVFGGTPGHRGSSPQYRVTDPTPPSEAPAPPPPPRAARDRKRPSHRHQGFSFLFLLIAGFFLPE